MRKTLLLAFMAFAFLLLWLNAGDLPEDGDFSLGTITPTITRIIESAPFMKPTQPPVPVPPPAAKREPASKPPPTVQIWLREESLRVGQIDAAPTQTLLRLKSKARSLTADDLKILKRSALDKNLNGDTRFLAVYMLGLVESIEAQTLLKEVCFAQIPEKASEREHSEEVILRAQSLESLVQSLSQGEAREMLRELIRRTSDPVLARHAQYWLSKLS